jgi:hypothetical protein
MKNRKITIVVIGWLLVTIIAQVSEVKATTEFPTLRNGLTVRHELEGGLIIVNAFYNTDYAQGQWEITDNKNVGIYLFVEKQPENTTILVEHVHVDCLICSNRSEINGIKQDGMDDAMHVGTQAGFYVSPQYSYSNIFAIEGYTEWLTSIWGFMWGNFGWMSGTEKRLTEDTLKQFGAKGSEFMVVFDLLIKNQGEENYHTISFMDDFIVYFNGGFQENPGSQSETKTITTYPWSDWGWIFWPGLVLLFVGILVCYYGNKEDSTALQIIGFILIIAGVILMFAGATCYFQVNQVEVPKVSS